MKTGLGIDTGGTYTDVVIFDFSKDQVLHSAKAPTTKENLSLGIIDALEKLPQKELQSIDLVSLSTTLATNACVEKKGGRAKLVFIDADKRIVEETAPSYGLMDTDEIFYMDGKVNMKGEVLQTPDWDKFLKNTKEWVKDIDASAIVQHQGIYNAIFEKKVKQLFEEEYQLESVCGHHLFSDLNYIKRGASCLLNAKLIPLIGDFLNHIKTSLKKLLIDAPVVIVRSDGTLMSEAITKERPVETLLCGPASSVIGGIHLTKEENAIVVDMGGTTTDLALVSNGEPIKTQSGAQVGDWKTFVKSVYIETFGLGGDSHITLDKKDQVELGPERAMPLCHAAQKWPAIKEVLAEQVKKPTLSNFPRLVFYYLVHPMEQNNTYYNQQEQDICGFLEKGAVNIFDLATGLDTSPYHINMDRLLKHGIVMRAGLTPTDIMHVRKDYTGFDEQTAGLACEYFSKQLHMSLEDFCTFIYTKVKESLYSSIVKMLLKQEYPNLKEEEIGSQLSKMIQYSHGDDHTFLNTNFKTPYSLIGIGAPIHIFLPDVAKALNTKAVIPPHASVANAVGAIVGNIIVKEDITILPDYKASGISGYTVFTVEENHYIKDYEEALSIATSAAKKQAKQQALHRGAVGEITVTTQTQYNQGEFETEEKKGSVHLDTVITATAVGKPAL